jgi:hypothetical protein
MLKTYKSLTGQAVTKDTYEAYKELIETIREMNHEELYDVMQDTETALKVLCRSEEKAAINGIASLIEEIVKLGVSFLQMHDHDIPLEVTVAPEWKKPYARYTYEFIEEKAKKEAKKE